MKNVITDKTWIPLGVAVAVACIVAGGAFKAAWFAAALNERVEAQTKLMDAGFQNVNQKIAELKQMIEKSEVAKTCPSTNHGPYAGR